MSADKPLSPLGLVLKRLLAGRDQRWLANATGIQETTISRWNRATHLPDTEKLLLVVAALGVTIDQFIAQWRVEGGGDRTTSWPTSSIPSDTQDDKAVHDSLSKSGTRSVTTTDQPAHGASSVLWSGFNLGYLKDDEAALLTNYRIADTWDDALHALKIAWRHRKKGADPEEKARGHLQRRRHRR